MVQIYEDEELKALIKTIRISNPEVNLSQKFKIFLKKEIDGFGDEDKLERLSRKLDEVRFRKFQAEEEEKTLLAEIQKENRKRAEQMKDEIFKNKKLEDLNNERIKTQINNIKEYYNIRNEKLILQLAEEFVLEHFKEMNLFEFMQSKGYEEVQHATIKN